MPGISLTLSTELACGMLNVAAAIGRPPVILFYLRAGRLLWLQKKIRDSSNGLSLKERKG